MRTVNCNLCGVDDYEVVFPNGAAHHRIVRCRRCGLMYANPQEHVDCETFAAQPDAPIFDPNHPHHRAYAQKQQVQLPDNLRALRVVDGFFPQRGRLLEIGSYLGIFLDQIRADGWKALGLEPDHSAAQYARKNYSLDIVEGTLPHKDLPAAGFDVVFLLHVIEHMPDPGANLREIRRLLVPGGVVVIETPRFNSLMFKILRQRERSVQNCPGHIYFFTEKTLQGLLEKSGFKVARIEQVGRTLTLERVLINIGIISRSPTVGRALSRMSQVLRLDRFRLYLNARDMQRMYAKAV
jgi:SAM-dependent methyltransferase